MSMLLCTVASVWAGPTDLPQITKDVNNPIYYTISNTRSEGKVMYYTAEGVRDENPQALTDAHKFFFTGDSYDNLKIHNAKAEKSSLLFNGSGVWTAEGTSCKISVTPHSSKAGLAIEYKGTSLNEHNQGRDTYCEWGANDAGSIYVMDLVAAWPEVGKLYVIEAPLFEECTGVAKGIYANDQGNAGWKATDITDKHHIWTVEYSAENGYAIKNYATGKYLSYMTDTDRFIAREETQQYLTLNFLRQGQFNIKSGGYSMHAGNHGNGYGEGSILCQWGGDIGSASAWKFVECQDPDALVPITITYNFTYKGEVTEYTQTVETFVGEEYPDITVAFPFGITATKPAGTIAADAGTTVTIALEENLPFAYYPSYNAIENWYYVKIKNEKYLYHTAGQDHIALDQAKVPAAGKAAYSWAFVGNPFDGFQIVNMAAGEGYILSSSTNTADGNTGANTHPVMTATPVAEGNNELWVLSNSPHFNGFYIEQKGHSSNKMNNRGDKLAYWNGGADGGSTFTVELRPSDIAALTALVAEAQTLLSQIKIGDAIGLYTSSYEGYEAAYSEIVAYVTAGEMQEDVAEEYLLQLTEIIASFSVNGLKAGKYYTLRNGDYYITSTVNDDRILCSPTDDIYYFDGEHLLAYNTGLYFGLNSTDWTFEAVGSTDISKITFAAVNGGTANVLNIKSADRWLHRTDGYVNRCSSNTCGELHEWTVKEVNSLPVTITGAKYATFYAPVAVEIHTDAKAYTVKIDGDKAILSELDKKIVPANTGVVLYSESATGRGAVHYLDVIESNATVENNALNGTVAATNVTTEAYVLSAPNGNVGFYKAAMNNGSWLNNSHKAYLPMPAGAQGVAYYSFTFDFEGTTGIENVQGADAETVIYDLTGRRVQQMNAAGIYIVNGKKVLVK